MYFQWVSGIDNGSFFGISVAVFLVGFFVGAVITFFIICCLEPPPHRRRNIQHLRQPHKPTHPNALRLKDTNLRVTLHGRARPQQQEMFELGDPPRVATEVQEPLIQKEEATRVFMPRGAGGGRRRRERGDGGR